MEQQIIEDQFEKQQFRAELEEMMGKWISQGNLVKQLPPGEGKLSIGSCKPVSYETKKVFYNKLIQKASRSRIGIGREEVMELKPFDMTDREAISIINNLVKRNVFLIKNGRYRILRIDDKSK